MTSIVEQSGHFIVVFVASPHNEPWQSINEKQRKNMLSIKHGYFQFLHVLAFHKTSSVILYYTCILYCGNMFFVGPPIL